MFLTGDGVSLHYARYGLYNQALDIHILMYLISHFVEILDLFSLFQCCAICSLDSELLLVFSIFHTLIFFGCYDAIVRNVNVLLDLFQVLDSFSWVITFIPCSIFLVFIMLHGRSVLTSLD